MKLTTIGIDLAKDVFQAWRGRTREGGAEEAPKAQSGAAVHRQSGAVQD